jgi:hypothetical protein
MRIKVRIREDFCGKGDTRILSLAGRYHRLGLEQRAVAV